MSESAAIVSFGRCLLPVAIGSAAGALAWLWPAGFDLQREGWDDPRWFAVAMPALIALSGGLGFAFPRRAAWWGVPPMLAQAVLAFAVRPTGNLMPIGLALFVGLTIPCVAAAAVGGALGRRRLAAAA